MNGLIAKVEAGFEPITGYVLRERLGAGGFGEVWMADAPGGLRKAIKFVFGSVDDDRAAGELKSLQRIRQVHHPFLLSLERIEIVEGQLMIVTELAECSLLERFQVFRSKGLVGVPRDRLLEYIRDAADALDFLCQNHDLQHLDVKPANLLLVADRVKVADFGLIKDIETQSMSMMGGLTLNYAAPEMFDGRPGRFSDQYSLAIVYQELLTGTLPFHGRTAAQLASEHMHKAPDLESLPPTDRPIVAKALSKKVGRRFASCREFVDQLFIAGKLGLAGASAEADAPPRPPGSAVARGESAYRAPALSARASAASNAISSINSDSSATASSITRLTPQLRERDVVDLPTESLEVCSHSPAMFVGLGGTGGDVLLAVRRQLEAFQVNLDEHPEWAWLHIDTDLKSLDKTTIDDSEGSLPAGCALYTPLHLPQYYRQQEGTAYTPLSRRWLYNVPRTRTTEGVRPLGMLAFLDSASRCNEAIQQYIQHFVQYAEQHPDKQAPAVRVYLVSSAHGGTGSAVLAEFAFLIQQAASHAGLSVVVQAAILIADQDQNEVAGAAALSMLTELAHFVRTDGLHPGIPGVTPDTTLSKSPVDFVHFAYGGECGRRDEWEAGIQDLATFLVADGCSGIGFSMDPLRQRTKDTFASSPDSDWTPWIRCVTGRAVDAQVQWTQRTFSDFATYHILQRWIARLASGSKRDSHEAAKDGKSSAKIGKHQAQIDYMISDLFRKFDWTAQAWIKSFVAGLGATLANQANVPGEVESLQHYAGTPLETPISRLASVIQASPLALEKIAFQMIQKSLADFHQWFAKDWAKARSSWCYLGEMLCMVGARFEEQGTSLCRVSAQLRAERDSLLQQIHADPSNPEQQQQSLNNIQALEVESMTHELAGQLLITLSNYLATMDGHWGDRSQELIELLAHWSKPLAESLGLSVDERGLCQESPLPTPSRWEPVRKHLDSYLESSLESVVFGQLCQVWNWPVTSDQAAIDLSDDTCETIRSQALETVQSKSTELQINIPAENPDEAQDAASTSRRSIGSASDLPIFKSALLKSGGAKRSILVLPADLTAQDGKQWQEQLGRPFSVAFSPLVKSPLVLCEGEQISLLDMIGRLWVPTQTKWNLATRLHSRIDIDWLPIDSPS
jgi:serine/threonine protein kinase